LQRSEASLTWLIIAWANTIAEARTAERAQFVKEILCKFFNNYKSQGCPRGARMRFDEWH
jgi:hypothetical protein